MSNDNLDLINPAAGAGDRSVVTVGQPSTLELHITSHGDYAVGFGDGQDCATLELTISADVLEDASFTVASPWSVSGSPRNDEHGRWTLSLATATPITLDAHGGTMQITIEGLVASRSGFATITVGCAALDLSAAAVLKVLDPPRAGEVLVGDGAALTFSYSLNGRQDGVIFVSPGRTPGSPVVENTVRMQIVFQPDNLPEAAKSAHPGQLLGDWDEADPPCFILQFPCFTGSGGGAEYADLTDAFRAGDPGYDEETSAWNIRLSLHPSEPGKVEDGAWRIELDRSGRSPVWKVRPLERSVFTATSGGADPGPILDLYFSHIRSSLPVDEASPQTLLHVQWTGFRDLSAQGKVLVDYQSGGNLAPLNKLPIPIIRRFELVPETYMARVQDKTHATTWAGEDGARGVFPPQSKLQFHLRWYIEHEGWYGKHYEVKLAAPVGSVAGGLELSVSDSELFEIDTATEAVKAIEPWTLRVVYRDSGNVVGEKKILPFVSLRDFLASYLPGRLYASAKRPTNWLLSFLSPSLAFWLVGQPALVTWTLTAHEDGTLAVALGPDGPTLSYDASADAWELPGDAERGSSMGGTWLWLCSGQILGGDEKVGLRAAAHRLFMAYREPKTGLVCTTSTADGWRWEAPERLRVASAGPPRLSYFRDRWVIAYVPAPRGAAAMITAAEVDALAGADPVSLPMDVMRSSVELMASGQRLFLYAQGTDGNMHVLYTQDIEGSWLDTTIQGDSIRLFENDSNLFVLRRAGKSGVVEVAALAPGDGPLRWICAARGELAAEPGHAEVVSPSGGVAMVVSFAIVTTAGHAIDLPAAEQQFDVTASLSYPGAWALFKNHLQVVGPIGWNFADRYLSSCRALFSCPQIVAGRASPSSQHSIATFAARGRAGLYLAYPDEGSRVRVVLSRDGRRFEETASSLAIRASEVALFAHGWRLWMAVVGATDGRVTTLVSDDGVTWSGEQLVSGISATCAPAFVMSATDHQLYLCIARKDGPLLWFRRSQDGAWIDVTTQGNTGLPGDVRRVALVSFRRSLVAITVDTADRIEVFHAEDFGLPWTAAERSPEITTDRTPAVAVLQHQLVVMYRDGASQMLKMVRSADGQRWTDPKTEPLHTSTLGGPSLTLWHDRLFAALETPASPGMISLITSAGVDATQLPGRSLVEEVTALLPGGTALSMAASFDPDGDPAKAQLHLLVVDPSSGSYSVHRRKKTLGPDMQVSWENVLSRPVPDRKLGYRLGRGFVVTAAGAIVLTVEQGDDPRQGGVKLIDPGPGGRDVDLGPRVNDVAYDAVRDVVCVASPDQGVWTLSAGEPLGNWQRLDAEGPGAAVIILPCSTEELFFPPLGFVVEPPDRGARSAPSEAADSLFVWANLTDQALYLARVAPDGSTEPALRCDAHTTSAKGTTKVGDVWLLSGDPAGQSGIHDYRIVEVPPRRLVVTPQGDLYALFAGSGDGDELHVWDSTARRWNAVRLRAVAITSDLGGYLHVATAHGQILQVRRSATAPARVGITSLGDTFITNIASIAGDADHTLWVVTNAGKVFRSLAQEPLASDSRCDVCVHDDLLWLAYRRGEDIEVVSSVDGHAWSSRSRSGSGLRRRCGRCFARTIGGSG